MTKRKCHEEGCDAAKSQRQQIRHNYVLADGIRDGPIMIVFQGHLAEVLSSQESTEAMQHPGKNGRSGPLLSSIVFSDHSLSSIPILFNPTNRLVNASSLVKAIGEPITTNLSRPKDRDP
jgi:hypothetical protein